MLQPGFLEFWNPITPIDFREPSYIVVLLTIKSGLQSTVIAELIKDFGVSASLTIIYYFSKYNINSVRLHYTRKKIISLPSVHSKDNVGWNNTKGH